MISTVQMHVLRIKDLQIKLSIEKTRASGMDEQNQSGGMDEEPTL
jgi:hypothetical protein